ncbi:hypothetical protein Golax_010303 [Gossypium laxum]|uniref:Uncharacterized protein n=2 Tax=Gossypium TaxID=3633 RepID=A0A7J8UCN8_9ROSI|nr:hypothetical protein [Gossypium klotzschianum]MBA0711071.1 hypothetical protein [Gossypium laxum]
MKRLNSVMKNFTRMCTQSS